MRFFSFLLVMFSVISCQSQNAVYKLDAISFQDKITATSDAVVMDVRTPEEFSNGYIEGAVNIDFRDK